jgi:oligoendopeptidase F
MLLKRFVALILLSFLISGMLIKNGYTGDEEKNRADIPDKYKWNLEDLYKSADDWKKAKGEVSARFENIKKFEGTLGNSAADLQKALDYYFDVSKSMSRIYSYASMLSDQDKRVSAPLAMKQESDQLYTQFSKVSAYIEPEILSIPKEKLDQFFKDDKGLAPYEHYVNDILRRKAHTLSPAEENLIAEAGRMASLPQDVYTILSNADLPRPTITLSDGKEVTLDASGYTTYRTLKNREDRAKVFEAFFGGLDRFRRTFGTELNGEVQKNIFYKNVRKYDSCLQSALDRNNIPVEVYHKLVENINKNLPTLQRYLQLRKRMLGVEELHYYDMYPSLVKKVDLTYTYQQAQDIIKDALGVLGQDYVATLDRAFNERWIDVYPSTGKTSGAYSNGGAYDVHPYILMNFSDSYEEMSTLAHELGHTMHSYYSNTHQPYPMADYPIFLAEVASTANEAILMDHELKRLKDPQERLSLLGNYLEGFRTTLFRQTQFAEFELRIHELAEQGVALTGDKFNEIYLDILKRYYGADKGITSIEDLYAIEWAYIPHFYLNFYVFQYSTSYLASQVLAEKMLSGESGMVDKYLAFLSSGNSEYAIPTLKKVGIDMTTDEPFELAMKKMNEIMDEIEAILKQLEK